MSPTPYLSMMSARQETTKDIPSVLVPGSETYEGVFKTEDGPRRVGFSIFRRPRGPDEPISEFPVSLEGSGFAGEIFTHEGVSHVRSDISHDHTFWTKDERIDCKWDVEEAEENEVDPNPDVFKRFDVAAELGGPVSCASRTILAPKPPASKSGSADAKGERESDASTMRPTPSTDI